jgi:hypothetical protein
MTSLKAPIPSDYSVQKQLMYTNLPPPLIGQIQTAVSLLGYKASLVETVADLRQVVVQQLLLFLSASAWGGAEMGSGAGGRDGETR